MNIQAAVPAAIDYAAIKTRQRAVWSAGDYARIGATLQIVGETLCEAVELGANHRVLDVCAGNGNATLAAARRFAEVVSTDYVEEPLERGRARAAANGFDVRFERADAEALPFDKGSFDVVLSTFGVMFTPDQRRAADEMLRVLRPGGKIRTHQLDPGGLHRPVAQNSQRARPAAAGRQVAGALGRGDAFGLPIWVARERFRAAARFRVPL
jgi:SAM-dependent methyltransferase